MKPTKKEVIAMCSAVNKVDDDLGGFADYEGGTDGPTWHLWNTGKERFDGFCDRAIALHRKALKVWEQAKKLNARR